LGFAFQPAAGMYAIKVTVNEQLEHGCRVIGRTAGVVGLRLEA
jgi:hypothetical protein